MQHHGAPTRLLDWTLSAYVAAFFAASGGSAKEVFAIWAVDYEWLDQQARITIADIQQQLDPRIIDSDDDFHDVFNNNRKFVAPVRPSLMIPRLAFQKGVFLCPGDCRDTFADNLAAMSAFLHKPNVIHKATCPGSIRRDTLIELNRLGVDDSTLFPGLDGYARSLKQQVSLEYGEKIGHVQFELEILPKLLRGW